jgi:hypothetical protein
MLFEILPLNPTPQKKKEKEIKIKIKEFTPTCVHEKENIGKKNRLNKMFYKRFNKVIIHSFQMNQR